MEKTKNFSVLFSKAFLVPAHSNRKWTTSMVKVILIPLFLNNFCTRRISGPSFKKEKRASGKMIDDLETFNSNEK